MCKGITDTFIDQLPEFFSKIQTLDLSMTSITSRGCFHLASLTSLQNLNISSISELDGRGIIALVTGKHQSKISDAEGEPGDKQQLSADEESFRIQYTIDRGRVSQLTTISAQFATDVNDLLFETLATQVPHLRNLDLRNCTGFDANGGIPSSLKQSLRLLTTNGVKVAFSRRKTSGVEH